jgi:hypothetical protein
MIAVVYSELSTCFDLASTRRLRSFFVVDTLLILEGKNRMLKDGSNTLSTALRRDKRGILQGSMVSILRQRILQASRQFNIVNP